MNNGEETAFSLIVTSKMTNKIDLIVKKNSVKDLHEDGEQLSFLTSHMLTVRMEEGVESQVTRNIISFVSTITVFIQSCRNCNHVSFLS